MNEPKRLYRSREQRMIGGVCGGIAEHFNIDPVIPRIVAVLLLLASFGTAIVIYMILWLIVPEAPETKPKVKVASPKKSSTKA